MSDTNGYVEYYIGWPGGTWTTDTVDLPINWENDFTTIEEFVEKHLSNLTENGKLDDYVFCGVYYYNLGEC